MFILIVDFKVLVFELLKLEMACDENFQLVRIHDLQILEDAVGLVEHELSFKLVFFIISFATKLFYEILLFSIIKFEVVAVFQNVVAIVFVL